MGSLYVGDLLPGVNEHDLLQIFNRAGKITSIRLCRDDATDNSLGYAYVNYSKKESAESAINTLNFTKINGKSCRVMWSEKESKKTDDANLFVKNLDKQLESKDLHEIFSQFGNILSCKVTTNEQGASLGYGYVGFERAEDAERAVTRLNRMFINGKEIQVSYFVAKSDRIQQKTTNFHKQPINEGFTQPSPSFKGQIRTNLYIKNLDKRITEMILRQQFERFGIITSVKIERDESYTSKGFGFVDFLNQQDATNAIKEMNGAMIGRKYIYVAYAQKKGERNQFLSQRFNSTDNIPNQTNRIGQGKYTPNPMHDTVYRRQSMGNIPVPKPNYTKEKRYSFGSEQESKTSSSTINSNFTHTPVIRVKSGEYLPFPRNDTREIFSDSKRQDNGIYRRQMPFSRSNERLCDYQAPIKAGSVPSSPTRKSSHNISFGQIDNRAREQSRNPIQYDLVASRLHDDPPALNKHLDLSSLRAKEKPVPLNTDFRLNIIENSTKNLQASTHKPRVRSYSGTTQTISSPVREKQRSGIETNMEELKLMSPTQQKETLGGILFQYIFRIYPSHAFEISEIFLQELGVEEIIKLLQCKERLKSQIKGTFDSLSNIDISSIDLEPVKIEHKPSLKQMHQTTPLYQDCKISLLTNSTKLFTDQTQSKERHQKYKNLAETKLNSQQNSTARNLNSGSKYQQECVENNDDVFTSVRTVSDKIYDVAKKEHPNEANLIVKLITEKCNGEQQQLIVHSDSLMENEVEKAHMKIRMLETPACLNYT